MKPSQVSAELKRIASSIDRCRKPVRPDLVAKDLRRVLAAMSYKDFDIMGPAPEGYDVGDEPNPFDVPVEVALTRGLKALQGGAPMYELVLPVEEGYGSYFEVIDDPVFMYQDQDGTVTVKVGDGYDAETAYTAPNVGAFDMAAAVAAIHSMIS